MNVATLNVVNKIKWIEGKAYYCVYLEYRNKKGFPVAVFKGKKEANKWIEDVYGNGPVIEIIYEDSELLEKLKGRVNG